MGKVIRCWEAWNRTMGMECGCLPLPGVTGWAVMGGDGRYFLIASHSRPTPAFYRQASLASHDNVLRYGIRDREPI